MIQFLKPNRYILILFGVFLTLTLYTSSSASSFAKTLKPAASVFLWPLDRIHIPLADPLILGFLILFVYTYSISLLVYHSLTFATRKFRQQSKNPMPPRS